MKIALVTTPISVHSGIADYTQRLLPYLREHCDVELYVEHGHDDPAWGNERAKSVLDLDPRQHDQVVYQLGNELHHGFMSRMVRAVGGTVVQHDWVLFDMAMGGYPSLMRGGLAGHLAALCQGGVGQMAVYARNWLDRRRQRNQPLHIANAAALDGTILAGWHEPDPAGRWTADAAWFRIPSPSVEAVEVDYTADGTYRVKLVDAATELAQGDGKTLAARIEAGDHPVLAIATSGIRVNREQRRHGDPRRLGTRVDAIRWRDADGEHELDLSVPTACPIRLLHLTRDRFALTFNRSVVRFADAFLVHSEYVRDLIVEDRNARTATAVVHHGAERLWRDDDRHEQRRAFGLDPAWTDSFLVTSFGGVQPHKRIDKALQALVLARRTHDDIRMVLAGSLKNDEFDPLAEIRRLGLEDAVRTTGFVSAEDGWSWLHAGDVALSLRGPSSGGTSGPIFQAFSLGRAVIASDAAEQRELPDSCVVKVPLGDGEVETLAQTLIDLRNDPTRRIELEASAREFVETECHWSVVAKQYAEHLDSFPKPKTTRRKLIALKSTLLQNTRARAK